MCHCLRDLFRSQRSSPDCCGLFAMLRHMLPSPGCFPDSNSNQVPQFSLWSGNPRIHSAEVRRQNCARTECSTSQLPAPSPGSLEVGQGQITVSTQRHCHLFHDIRFGSFHSLVTATTVCHGPFCRFRSLPVPFGCDHGCLPILTAACCLPEVSPT